MQCQLQSRLCVRPTGHIDSLPLVVWGQSGDTQAGSEGLAWRWTRWELAVLGKLPH